MYSCVHLISREFAERGKNLFRRNRQRSNPRSDGVVDGIADRRRNRNDGRLRHSFRTERAGAVAVLPRLKFASNWADPLATGRRY